MRCCPLLAAAVCAADEGLLQLAKGCSSLTALSLYWNVKYTDVGISAIVKSRPMPRPATMSICMPSSPCASRLPVPRARSRILGRAGLTQGCRR